VKSRPILFSAPMVRALLAGTKTQTRRAMKPQPSREWIPVPELIEIHGRDRDGNLDPDLVRGHGFCSGDGEEGYECRYGVPGDRLWVRETWCHKFDDNGMIVYNADRNFDSTCCWFAADGVEVTAQDGDGFTRYRKDGTEASPWTPSIHMPRWASRITLELTDVRVQRLQDISEEDARAEGIVPGLDDEGWQVYGDRSGIDCSHASLAYRDLWNEINGAGSWDANPWVWALTFQRVTA
jgi:hypothetical protein